MKMDVKACSAASAVLWSGAVLLTGIINLAEPAYGKDFLRLVASIYPGYKARPTPGQVAIATGYAVLDGAGSGALFALLYNCFACERQHP